MPEPKKQQKRRHRLNLTKKQIWERIVKEVEKTEVPLNCIDSIEIHLKDGTEIILDIDQLLSEGNDPGFLESAINEKLEALDDIIEDVNFMISIEKVSGVVQPYTDQVLKHL